MFYPGEIRNALAKLSRVSSVYIPNFATSRISPCHLYTEYLCKYDNLSFSICCVGSTAVNTRFENNPSISNCVQVHKAKRYLNSAEIQKNPTRETV